MRTPARETLSLQGRDIEGGILGIEGGRQSGGGSGADEEMAANRETFLEGSRAFPVEPSQIYF